MLGSRIFQADIVTPKGLDDRTEGAHVLQRAHEIAAEAWNADFCRFVAGGSTLSLHMALAAIAHAGDTVLFAAKVPGQRISTEHVAWLVANRETGMFLLDPTDPSERTIQCVAEG